MTTKANLGVALLAMLAWAGVSPADEAAPLGPASPVVGDDLNSALEMTEAQQREQQKRGAPLRFAAERLEAAIEIKGDLLYLKKDIDAATAILEDAPANTQKDNIERICGALAKADARFARAHDLFAKKQYKEAAEGAKKILDPRRATFLTAATYTLYAESQAQGGDVDGAIDTYGDLLGALPYHMSFASAAGVRIAQLYEKGNRFYHAMHAYNNVLRDYMLVIGPEQQQELSRKVDEYAAIYDEPMKALVDRMGDARTLLDAADSGARTQKKEQEVIAILDDLIKTMEEADSKPPPKPKDDKGKGKKEGSEGQESKPAGAGGQPVVNARPNSPANVSKLPGGRAAAPPPMEKVFDAKERGDWADLPPLERAKIQQKMERAIAERYRDAIRDYHRRLAEQGEK
jgi:tetratricopeptide (TPR) repeat protein